MIEILKGEVIRWIVDKSNYETAFKILEDMGFKNHSAKKDVENIKYIKIIHSMNFKNFVAHGINAYDTYEFTYDFINFNDILRKQKLKKLC